jgi:hypothetical protein
MTNTYKIELIEKELENLQDAIILLRWCFEASKRCLNDSYDEKEFEEKLRNLRTEIYDLTEDKEENFETLVKFIISMLINDEISFTDTKEYLNKVVGLKQEYICLKNDITDLVVKLNLNKKGI